MLKKLTVSPAQPRRAKTRLSPGKARSERKAEDVHTELRVNRSF
jgi:hypothetical protein